VNNDFHCYSQAISALQNREKRKGSDYERYFVGGSAVCGDRARGGGCACSRERVYD
jgi:hypothetical protein